MAVHVHIRGRMIFTIQVHQGGIEGRQPFQGSLGKLTGCIEGNMPQQTETNNDNARVRVFP